MGNGRITQHGRNFSYTKALFIQQVFGVFHTLALVKIKDGGAKKLLKPFFKVTFVDGNLAAKRFNG